MAIQERKSLISFLGQSKKAIIGHPWYFILGLVSLVATGELIWLAEHPSDYTAIYHTLAGVCLLISFHSFEKLYSEEIARVRAEQMVDDIANKMTSGITSLHELNSAHVREVFASRISAQKLMANAISRRDNQELLLMGVSLNDFLGTGVHQALEELSSAFKEFVTSPGTSVRVLLVDPNSEAAELRETAEELNTRLKRLEKEARASIEMLENLFESRQANSSDEREPDKQAEPGRGSNRIVKRGVSPDTKGDDLYEVREIQYRLYRSMPTLFMLITNHECFIQPYYSWPRRGLSPELPMFHITLGEKCSDISGLIDDGLRRKYKSDNDMFTGMLSHFSWIWHQCSITGEEHKALLADTAKQAKRENLTAIYSASPPEFGKERIKRIVNEIQVARKKVWIVGFTLKFFFDDGEAREALFQAAKRFGDVRIILIDPECTEAKLRMFRERDLDPSDETAPQVIANRADFEQKFAQFQADQDLIKSMTLFKDVSSTLQKARESERRFKRREKVETKDRLLSIKQLDHFPACFMCLIDDMVFVEQYHFGEGIQGELGKDMPILEFQKKEAPNGQKLPYELLESHFQFLWEISRESGSLT